MNEKLKMQQRDNELNRLVHELEMKVLNQESVRTEQEAQDSRCVRASPERCCLKRDLRFRLGSVNLHTVGLRCWSRSWSCL